MDLGLYQLKYPVRRLIGGAVPMLRGVHPDIVSWSILPVGIATAICYFFADPHPVLLIVAPVLILLRMFLATLDGLLAAAWGNSPRCGEIVNRLPPEICDILLFIALGQAPDRRVIGLLALGMCWLTTFSGLVGLTAGAPVQSVGPAGQTDRLAALIVLSLIGFVSQEMGHPLNVLKAFLWWLVIGGAITIVLRLRRSFRAVRTPR
jgi:phosphatidylglycerophosphate synthase